MPVTGLQKILRNLDKAQDDVKHAVAAGVYQMGFSILGKAQKLTPVDVGRLRASAYASPPKSIDKPEVEIGFGTDYALAVHERVEVFHEVGQPLFLKRAVDEARPRYTRSLATKARRNLARRVRIGGVSSEFPKDRESGRASGEQQAAKSGRKT
jgi:hypothetical protein